MGQVFSSDDPCHIGLEWVRARLAHDPRTRLLDVCACAQAETLVLEGQVSSLADKAIAGQVSRRAQRQGFFDNQIQVLDSDTFAQGLPRPLSSGSLIRAA